MTHEQEKEQKRSYDEAFVERCKDLAVLGLQPSQIAERLGLVGVQRRDFLLDCTNPVHPLHALIFEAWQHSEDDLHASLVTAACSGDPDALELAFKVKAQDKYDELKLKLFGI